MAAASKRKKLTGPEVERLIEDLLRAGLPSRESLLAFAETINGAPFKQPPKPKAKSMTMTAAKKAVLSKFSCKTVAELRKNKTFTMSMTGEEINLLSLIHI